MNYLQGNKGPQIAYYWLSTAFATCYNLELEALFQGHWKEDSAKITH